MAKASDILAAIHAQGEAQQAQMGILTDAIALLLQAIAGSQPTPGEKLATHAKSITPKGAKKSTAAKAKATAKAKRDSNIAQYGLAIINHVCTCGRGFYNDKPDHFAQDGHERVTS